MIFKLIGFSLLFISHISFSAPEPSNSRFEISFGQSQLDYLEVRNFGLNQPTEQNQKGYEGSFTWQYFLFPPYWDIEAKFKYSDGSIESSVPGEQVTLVETILKTSLRTPLIGERFALGFAGEYYHIENLTSHDQFSLARNFFFRGYPIIDFFPTGFRNSFNFSFYLKKPLFLVNVQGSQLSVGVNLFFPLGGSAGLRYPLHTYQKSFVINLDYTDLDIVITEGTRRNTYTIQKLSLSLGYNF